MIPTAALMMQTMCSLGIPSLTTTKKEKVGMMTFSRPSSRPTMSTTLPFGRA